jgi:hypothetical protein
LSRGHPKVPRGLLPGIFILLPSPLLPLLHPPLSYLPPVPLAPTLPRWPSVWPSVGASKGEQICLSRDSPESLPGEYVNG